MELERSTLRTKLEQHTPARVGLARAGSSIGVADQLRFQLDHALARDAVHARLDVDRLLDGLRQRGMRAVALGSAVPEGVEQRRVYLRRPDLGRRLSEESAEAVRALGEQPADVVFVIADGLSALAVDRHALALLDAVAAALDGLQVGPVCVVSQGRVAIGDDIGERLRARVVVVMIGERPGLSAADSLGVYITSQPRVGRTDAERVCVSNIRPGGLGYVEAAERIGAMLQEARRMGSTGVSVLSGGSAEVGMKADLRVKSVESRVSS